jgi:hypothetical protein
VSSGEAIEAMLSKKDKCRYIKKLILIAVKLADNGTSSCFKACVLSHITFINAFASKPNTIEYMKLGNQIRSKQSVAIRRDLGRVLLERMPYISP